MTTKHTPGPWHLSAAKDCIWHQDHGRICTPPNHAQVWNWEPNARLIAAAPDLLAALEGMVAEFGIHCDENSPIGAACAAIAKAKGEQPRPNAGLHRAAFPHMSPAEYLAQRLREDDEDLQDLMDRDMGG